MWLNNFKINSENKYEHFLHDYYLLQFTKCQQLVKLAVCNIYENEHLRANLKWYMIMNDSRKFNWKTVIAMVY